MSLPDNGIWTEGASMPTARYDFGCETVNKKIYCAGGSSKRYSTGYEMNVVEVYDTENGTWMTVEPMPEALCSMGTAVVEDKIYFIGGRRGEYFSDRIYIYDTTNNKWSLSPHVLPLARYQLKCCYAEGKIYCAAGTENDYLISTGDLDILDLKTGTWTKGKSLYAIAEGCLHHSKGNLYWIGGATNRIENYDTLIYNIAGNTWGKGAKLAVNRKGYGSDICDDKIYMAGGVDYEMGEHLNACLVYDINSDSFITLPSMPDTRVHCRAAIVDNKLYVIGGTEEAAPIYIYQEETPAPPEPPVKEHSCDGSIKLEINIPISNNLEMLDKVKEIVNAAKGCDNSNLDK